MRGAHRSAGDEAIPRRLAQFSVLRRSLFDGLLALVESGLAAKEREKEHFFELAEQLAKSTSRSEQKRLKAELARLTKDQRLQSYRGRRASQPSPNRVKYFLKRSASFVLDRLALDDANNVRPASERLRLRFAISTTPAS